MSKKRNLFIHLFLIVGFFALLLCSCKTVDREKRFSENDLDESYQSGWDDAWDEAQKRLKNSGYYSNEEVGAINSLTGRVSKINNNEILIEIKPLGPLADPDLNYRTIKMDVNTRIFKITKKDDVQYQEELIKYQKDNPNYKNNPMAEGIPNMYYEKLTTKENIELDQNINVKSVEDITNKKVFVADELTILF